MEKLHDLITELLKLIRGQMILYHQLIESLELIKEKLKEEE